jgi:two-component system cell cycle sensor histidine kinase PleC
MIPVRSYNPPARSTTHASIMADWVRSVAPLRPNATCGEAFRIFTTDPNLVALAVVEEGRPLGMVSRNQLIAALSDRFAPACGEGEKVTRLMDPDPLTVEATMDFNHLVALLDDGRPDALLAGFIVTHGGIYVGVGSARSVLQAGARRLAAHGREIERTRMEATESNKSKAQFLAAVSHELRTPLNAIIGFSQIIAQGTFGPEEFERYRSYAQDIQSSGEHLLEVINDILDLSRVEAGKLVLREESIGVVELVESTLRLVRQRATEGRLTLETDIPDCCCQMRGDKRLLRQLLLNLVANAVKFTPAGGKIMVRSAIKGDDLLFVVADTGIGIAKEDIPKAMTPFGQVDSRLARRYDGTGLGLPLAKAMAEAHGGSLEIESTLGIGTTVTVRLPRARVIVDQAGKCAPHECRATETGACCPNESGAA